MILERIFVIGSFKNIIGLFFINNGILFVMCFLIECLIVVVLLFYYCVMISSRKMLLCVVCIVVYLLIFCLFQLSGIFEGVYLVLQFYLNMIFLLIVVFIFNFVFFRVLCGYRKCVFLMSFDVSDSFFFVVVEKRIDIDKQFVLIVILIVLFFVLLYLLYYLMIFIEVYCLYCNGEWVVLCCCILLFFLFLNVVCNFFMYMFCIFEC